MADGRLRQDWDLTSYLCHVIANSNSSGKKFKPKDFNPYLRNLQGDAESSKMAATVENIKSLKKPLMGLMKNGKNRGNKSGQGIR